MRGWYSGELHIHANYGYGSWFNTPRTMRQQCIGEDGVRYTSFHRICTPHGDVEIALDGLLDERRRESRLPDAAFAGDEHRPARSTVRGLQRAREDRKLGAATRQRPIRRSSVWAGMRKNSRGG